VPILGCTALSLDGVDGWVEVPNVPATIAQTLEAWVDFASASPTGCIVRTNCAGVCVTGNTFVFEVFPNCNGTGSRWYGSIPTPSIPSGVFHFALVFPTSNQASLYVDGLLAGSTALAFDGGVSGTYLGALAALKNDGVPMGFLAATMYAVRVSNAAVYAGPFVPGYPLAPSASTALLYAFSDGSGTTLTDSSGGNRHGSIHGGATWSTSGCP
jgi:hypothetical protein